MIPSAIGPVTPASLTTRADKDAYEAAQGFERLLIGELTKTMKPAGETEGPYADQLPEHLADSLSRQGGLGLADQLFRAMRTT